MTTPWSQQAWTMIPGRWFLAWTICWLKLWRSTESCSVMNSASWCGLISEACRLKQKVEESSFWWERWASSKSHLIPHYGDHIKATKAWIMWGLTPGSFSVNMSLCFFVSCINIRMTLTGLRQTFILCCLKKQTERHRDKGGKLITVREKLCQAQIRICRNILKSLKFTTKDSCRLILTCDLEIWRDKTLNTVQLVFFFKKNPHCWIDLLMFLILFSLRALQNVIFFSTPFSHFGLLTNEYLKCEYTTPFLTNRTVEIEFHESKFTAFERNMMPLLWVVKWEKCQFQNVLQCPAAEWSDSLVSTLASQRCPSIWISLWPITPPLPC